MQSKSLTLGSLFSGIGGFELAASLYDIEPVWASEIDPNCISVTKQHFPNMVHLGSILDVHGDRIPPVDIIAGGSPCTNLSQSGNRSGIAYICESCGANIPIEDRDSPCPVCGHIGSEPELTESGLFIEQIRVIREMRRESNEQYPKVVIWENVPGCLTSNGGDDFYYVLKEFCTLLGEGLPTLRPQKWSDVGEILADKGSLAWRILDAQYWGVPQRRRRVFLVIDFTGERAGEILFKSESLRRSTPKGKISWSTASKTSGGCSNSTDERGVLILENHPHDSRLSLSENNVCQTLTARMGTGGNNTPILLTEGNIYMITDASHNTVTKDLCPTLTARDYKDPNVVCKTGDRLRRVTPVECERLQGFPSGWTETEIDSARYRMLGNSVAVPCVTYIMGGIVDILNGDD